MYCPSSTAVPTGPAWTICAARADLPVAFAADDEAHQHHSSLEWLRANVDDNRDAVERRGGRIEAHALEWSNAQHASDLRTMCLPAAGDEFDLLVGSELLYDPDNYEPLLRVLCEFGSAQHTPCILGYTRRHDGEDRFLRLAEQRGFRASTRRFDGTETAGGPAWAVTRLVRTQS